MEMLLTEIIFLGHATRANRLAAFPYLLIIQRPNSAALRVSGIAALSFLTGHGSRVRITAFPYSYFPAPQHGGKLRKRRKDPQ
jgi:hypothetical protein